MSKTKFWQLSPPDKERLLAKRVSGAVKSQIVKCPVCSGHQRGGKRLGPLSVSVPKNYRFDFVWTWLSDCLVSPRALDVFVQNELTGFEVERVHVKYTGTQAKKTGFLLFKPVGWGGVAPADSGVELLEFCEGCGHTHYSGFTRPEFLIDESQWDGSDFFIVWPLPRFIFISERARAVIMENQVGGSIIKPLESLKSGITINQKKIEMGLSPGKLEDYFPKAKVQEIKAKYNGIE